MTPAPTLKKVKGGYQNVGPKIIRFVNGRRCCIKPGVVTKAPWIIEALAPKKPAAKKAEPKKEEAPKVEDDSE